MKSQPLLVRKLNLQPSELNIKSVSDTILKQRSQEILNLSFKF